MTDSWLTSADMMARYKISYVTLWRKCRNGELPPPEKLGKLNRWHPSKIRDHEKRRMSRANAAAA